MKKSLKLLFCATALASLAGCNKFDEADTAPDSGNGSLIKVYAKVATSILLGYCFFMNRRFIG